MTILTCRLLETHTRIPPKRALLGICMYTVVNYVVPTCAVFVWQRHAAGRSYCAVSSALSSARNNVACLHAGAIYMSTMSSAVFNGSTSFLGNEAGDDGGEKRPELEDNAQLQ